MNKYDGMTLWELMDESNRKDLTGKEARMLHKALRKHGDGLPMFMRYPNLPLWISIGTVLLVAAGSILRGIPQ